MASRDLRERSGHIASVVARASIGGLGALPPVHGVQGQMPLVRGSGGEVPLKLTRFLQMASKICTKTVVKFDQILLR